MGEQHDEPSGLTIDGFVDGFDGRWVSGWACDRADPGRRLRIEICVGDDVVTVPADRERPDVAAAGRATGFCGFSAELYLDVSNFAPIRVREASTGTELPGSPLDPPLPRPIPGPDAGAVEGFIDFVDGNRIVGWAHDRALPGRRVQVEIAVGDARTVVPADEFREDVAAAGVNDGRCGFAFSFDAQAATGRLIRVRDAATGIEFRGSPFRADIPSRLAGPDHREALAVLRAEALLTWDEIGRAFVPWAADALPRPGSKLERLLEPACPESDPEGLVTRYLAFEIARSERRDLTPDGTLVERMRALHWYLTECNIYHRIPVPLSRRQLAFLNASMPLLGVDAEVSVAAHAFVTAELDAGIDLRDRASLHRALCWWALDRAPRIAPGGELVAPAAARALTVADPTGDFPLTAALRDLCAGDRNLARLGLRSDVDRAVLAASVALRSLGQPHLAALLPDDLARALLYREAPDRDALLDVLMRLALGPAEAGAPAAGADGGSAGSASRQRLGAVTNRAEALCERVRAVLGASARASPPQGAGRPFLRDPRLADGLDPGVAVIGPMRATSGLGQAARLSYDVLARAGRDPAQFDFFPGNPALVGFADRTGAAALRVPRRINLIHLNAEVVPHAFALLDGRLTERSYNIGYFFWEL